MDENKQNFKKNTFVIVCFLCSIFNWLLALSLFISVFTRIRFVEILLSALYLVFSIYRHLYRNHIGIRDSSAALREVRRRATDPNSSDTDSIDKLINNNPSKIKIMARSELISEHLTAIFSFIGYIKIAIIFAFISIAITIILVVKAWNEGR